MKKYGSGCGSLKVLSLHLPQEIEKNNEKTQDS
jgi:hypothetical protein